MNVIERGAASAAPVPPLLFVHGACLGAWCWEDHFLADFSRRGYHSAALDLRGHGESAGHGTLPRATIDDYVTDVAHVAARLEAPPVIIGHSMGGLIAQRFAARHPASGMVLLASSPTSGMRRYGWTLVRAHPVPFLRAMLERQMLRIYSDNRRVRGIMFSPGTPEATVGRCRERLQPESWRACMEMNDPVSPPLTIPCPILVLGAELDRTVPAEAVVETGKAYRAPTHVFSGVGHNLMLEPSWLEVADRIDQWIRTNIRPHRHPGQ